MQIYRLRNLKNNAQPFYVLVGNDEKVLVTHLTVTTKALRALLNFWMKGTEEV